MDNRIAQLPTNVILDIIRVLPIQDVVRLQMASKQIANLVRNDIYWMETYRHSFGDANICEMDWYTKYKRSYSAKIRPVVILDLGPRNIRIKSVMGNAFEAVNVFSHTVVRYQESSDEYDAYGHKALDGRGSQVWPFKNGKVITDWNAQKRIMYMMCGAQEKRILIKRARLIFAQPPLLSPKSKWKQELNKINYGIGICGVPAPVLVFYGIGRASGLAIDCDYLGNTTISPVLNYVLLSDQITITTQKSFKKNLQAALRELNQQGHIATTQTLVLYNTETESIFKMLSPEQQQISILAGRLAVVEGGEKYYMLTGGMFEQSNKEIL